MKKGDLGLNGLVFVALVMAAFAGCKSKEESAAGKGDMMTPSGPGMEGKPGEIQSGFRDITTEIGFKTPEGHPQIITTMFGPGLASADFDGDGDVDVFAPGGYRPAALYRNNGDWKFEEITMDSGLAAVIYGAGATAADMDNDGDPDLVIAGQGRDYIFENLGGMKFANRSHLNSFDRDSNNTRHAAVFDADGDGLLDIFFSNYTADWNFEQLANGFLRTEMVNESWLPTPRLFLNRGGFRFEELPPGDLFPAKKASAWVALPVDIDDDGVPEIWNGTDFAALEAVTRQHGKLGVQKHFDHLFRQTKQDFDDPGVAYKEVMKESVNVPEGHSLDEIDSSTMAIAANDYDHDGDLDLALGMFWTQNPYFINDKGKFNVEPEALTHEDVKETEQQIDKTTSFHAVECNATLDLQPGRRVLITWALQPMDYDRDGRVDIHSVNGWLFPTDCHQPDELWRNTKTNMFANAAKGVLPREVIDFQGRGTTYADFDGDGDTDYMTANLLAPISVIKNDIQHKNQNFIRIKLTGTTSNRDGVGAVIIAKAGGIIHRRDITTGGSTGSSNPLETEITAGDVSSLDEIRIRWPSGYTQLIPGPIKLPTRQTYVEPKLVELVDAELKADSAHKYRITVFPRDERGELRKAVVAVESPHVKWAGEVQTASDGSAFREFTVAADRNYARLRITIDGKPLLVRPVLRRPPAPMAPKPMMMDKSGELVARWIDVLAERTAEDAHFPPNATRIFAYTSIAMYEAMVHDFPDMQSLAPQLKGLTVPQAGKDLDCMTAGIYAATAVYEGLSSFVCHNSRVEMAGLRDAIRQEQAKAGVPQHVIERGAEHGDKIAAAVVAWANKDGYLMYRSQNYRFSVKGDESAWEATGRDKNKQAPLEPHWGKLRTFALKDGEECMPKLPFPFSTDPKSPYYAQMKEVYDVHQNLNAEQRHIATFWADNPGHTSTPAGHWLELMAQFVRDQKWMIDKALEVQAMISIALADTVISSWATKYKYYTIRPETYIERYIDKRWEPYIRTPPFPDFTSGHSTMSGSMTRILPKYIPAGPFTDRTRRPLGLGDRTFESVYKAAKEASTSRLYGGIHTRMANEEGFHGGECIGDAVLARIKPRK
ncbi:MAG: hypothetical protein GMKNLPBB_00327 [Myxococcota bacterium]|nr:hypothetical protein [Myxococcota bacterium]